LTAGRDRGHDEGDPNDNRGAPAMDERTNEELRAELERLRKERDEYRATVARMLKLHYGIDVNELEEELRNVREHGGIPWSQLESMLETEFGIRL
jgi:hypothetical protein